MFPDFEHSMPASSSPPSSPTAYNDSSPASSPRPEFDNHPTDSESSFPDDCRDVGGAHPLPDPFSASAKGWIPPDVEKGAKQAKKIRRASDSPGRAKKRRLVGPEASLETLVARTPRVSLAMTDEQREAGIWDEAGGTMIDRGNGTVNLDGFNLSAIPQKFIDVLDTFCVLDEKEERLNARPVSPPAALPRPSTQRSFTRSTTAPAILGRVPGFAAHDINLSLAGNRISRVPAELLQLEKLKLLSLRNNQLTSLPPDIRHLKNLHTLNVAGNQLQYLPAEIQELTLQKLIVFPNPFIVPSPDHGGSILSQGRVAVSPTAHLLPCVPTLVELAFRVLFSSDSGSGLTRLERYYALPLCEADEILRPPELPKRKEFRKVIPSHLRAVLDKIHPGSVDMDRDASTSPTDGSDCSLGVCPAPRHTHAESVFVKPAEERYTWETVVARVDLGGGGVPLKWRGCLWRCLDFLDAGTGIGGEGNATVGESEMEVDEGDGDGDQDVVTRAQFSSASGLQMDFDDDG